MKFGLEELETSLYGMVWSIFWCLEQFRRNSRVTGGQTLS